MNKKEWDRNHFKAVSVTILWTAIAAIAFTRCVVSYFRESFHNNDLSFPSNQHLHYPFLLFLQSFKRLVKFQNSFFCLSESIISWIFDVPLLSIVRYSALVAITQFSMPRVHLSPFSRGFAQWVEIICNRRVEYWAIRSSVCSFARTTHSFTCSALLASLARSAALIRSLRSSSERGFCLWIERVDLIQF